MIGARSNRYFVVFCLTASQLAYSSANSQTPISPPILTSSPGHRSAAELRVVGIETSRTESPIEEPTPESNDLAMSHLHIREIIVSPSSVNQRVSSQLAIKRIYNMWFYRIGL